jgi:hypothetical protein
MGHREWDSGGHTRHDRLDARLAAKLLTKGGMR